MVIQAGQIVKNLILSEPVSIAQVEPLGSMVSIKFKGINSNKTKVIASSEFVRYKIMNLRFHCGFKGAIGINKRCSIAHAINPFFRGLMQVK